MKYICSQKHTFTHPATMTNHAVTAPISIGGGLNWQEREFHTCPICTEFNVNYEEYIEPEPQEVVNVLVIELTTGPQLQIDKALADGYKIVARYSKTYTLEKCKPKTSEEIFKEIDAKADAIVDENQRKANEFYSKLEGKQP